MLNLNRHYKHTGTAIATYRYGMFSFIIRIAFDYKFHKKIKKNLVKSYEN